MKPCLSLPRITFKFVLLPEISLLVELHLLVNNVEHLCELALVIRQPVKDEIIIKHIALAEVI